jgi:hypothetical protein
MTPRKPLPRGWKRVHGRDYGTPECCEWCGFPDPWDDDDGATGTLGYMLHESGDAACSVSCARKISESREGVSR